MEYTGNKISSKTSRKRSPDDTEKNKKTKKIKIATNTDTNIKIAGPILEKTNKSFQANKEIENIEPNRGQNSQSVLDQIDSSIENKPAKKLKICPICFEYVTPDELILHLKGNYSNCSLGTAYCQNSLGLHV